MARVPVRTLAGAFTLGGIVALLVATPAFAGFEAPLTLSPAGGGSFEAQVSTDPTGDATAVWYHVADGSNARVQARTVSAAGVPGPIRTLSPAGAQGADQPQVATDVNGNAIVVWQRSDGANLRIESRAVSLAGALGPIRTLSGGGRDASDPQVATDNTGDAIVVWERSDGANNRIESRTISSAGTLGPVRTLSGPGQSASQPQVATDNTGDGVAAWQRSDGANVRVQARTLPAAGAPGPVRTLSAQGGDALLPQVATDASGDAIAVWRRHDGTTWRAQARTLSSAGSLGAVKTLSLAGQEALEPDVATDATGDAIAVWQRSGATFRIEARTISPAGALGPLLTLSDPATSAFVPKVATSASGDAVAAWQHAGGRIEARAVPAAGRPGALQVLSLDRPEPGFDPQIAVDDFGGAIAVWRRLDDSADSRIEASLGP